MKLHFVDNMDQVLAVALEDPLPVVDIPAEQPIPLTSPEPPSARQ